MAPKISQTTSAEEVRSGRARERRDHRETSKTFEHVDPDQRYGREVMASSQTKRI